MTRRLSGIHAAWHFWFAVSFGGESGLRKLGLCGTHPLTRRYALIVGGKISGKSKIIYFVLLVNPRT
ncbi:DUF3265 domain-containing protein [Vibrio vulnificus]|nr:DUF3265 domain-containing protein [Vibrio vulnificus]